jgi:hypothetical protein
MESITMLKPAVSKPFEIEDLFRAYRPAVSKYKYLIENRVTDLAGTEIRLGDIGLGDMDQLVKAKARELATRGVNEVLQKFRS